MGIVAVVPLANMVAANAALDAAGFGPSNFSVPAFGNGNPTHACLHAWGPVALENAVKAIAGATWDQGAGAPSARLRALLATAGAQWGEGAALLPSSGNAIAGTLYRFDEQLWWCIQTFSRTTFGLHPSTYPALIRLVRRPGEILPWVQPLDQFDAYWTKNRFTGQPDRVTHNGRLWRSIVAEATPNTWPPGTAGIWADEGPAP